MSIMSMCEYVYNGRRNRGGRGARREAAIWPTKNIKSLKITTYKSVYINKSVYKQYKFGRLDVIAKE